MDSTGPTQAPSLAEAGPALAAADALLAAGRYQEAEAAYRALLAKVGADPRLLHRLGLVLKAAGRYEDALRMFLAARGDPAAPLETTLEAARIAAAMGRAEEAQHWLRDAAFLNPQRAEPHLVLGHLSAQRRAPAEAARSFERALAIDPGHGEALKGLALALLDLDRPGEAETAARRRLAAAPEDATALALLSRALAGQGRFTEALDAAESALAREPASLAALLQKAHALSGLGREDEAIATLERASTLAPNRAAVRSRLGKALKAAGEIARAREAFVKALAIDPAHCIAYLELADIHAFTANDPLIAEMERLVARLAGRPDDLRLLHFALGKAYDDAGAPEAAFRHFEAANAIERQSFRYDEQAELARIDAVRANTSPQWLRGFSGRGIDSQLPIFIVGMPRSGSTLVEQILASHPQVAGGGEMNHFALAVHAALGGRAGAAPAFWAGARLTADDAERIGKTYIERIAPLAKGRARITDKQLANAELVGLIHIALPHAKIIRCVRDPVDTCLSCYSKPFGARIGYASDLGALGRYYRHHEMLMRHWQELLPAGVLIDVRYEDIVADYEREARRILAHCGLDWDDACAAPHKAERSVHTASAAQVRRPLYSSSIGRGEAYGALLAPLILALGGGAG